MELEQAIFAIIGIPLFVYIIVLFALFIKNIID